MLLKTNSIVAHNRLGKIIHFPLTRIVLSVLFVIIGVSGTQLVIGLLGTATASPAISMFSIFIALLAVYFAYRLYVQWIEKRQVTELSANGAIQELFSGMLIGFGIITTVIGILWALGSYQMKGLNPWLVLIPAAAANIPSGFVQEILFRGILLRITRESLGAWIALALSSVLFGLIHIFSAGANLFSTLSIMLEAGLLLGAAYILTQKLWLAIGIHIAWDFAIDGIFGVGSSALADKPINGLFQARLVGMDLLSGGTHGVEASVVAILVTLVAGGFLTWLAWRSKKFVDEDRNLNRK